MMDIFTTYPLYALIVSNAVLVFGAAIDTIAPDEACSDDQIREELADAVSRLPEKERLVISLYYELELNLKEVGEVFGVSESRICQMHGQALARLRASVNK